MDARGNALRVALVGAGGVAWGLGKALLRAGVSIDWIYSRFDEHSKALADALECSAFSGDARPSAPTELLIVAVPDAVCLEVCTQFADRAHYVVHTSGATPAPPIPGGRGGVFYPLQTFAQRGETSLQRVPCLIEAEGDELRGVSEKLAMRLGMAVYYASSQERRWIHLLGVLSNNFVNHLLRIVATIGMEHAVQPGDEKEGRAEEPAEFVRHLLEPILTQTIGNAMSLGPLQAQTGPARRGDAATLARHRAMLSEHYPQFLLVYDALTESIGRSFQRGIMQDACADGAAGE